MRAILAAVLLSCIVALACWALAWDEPPAPPRLADAPAHGEPTDGAVQASAPVDTSMATDAAREHAVVQLAAPLGEVWVVAADGKTRVPGVDVHFVPPDFELAKADPELQQLAKTDSDAFLQRVSRVVTTDATGRCWVPTGRGSTAVRAMHGDEYAEGTVVAGAKFAAVLTLLRDHTLTIRVLTSSGRPAHGALVGAEQCDDDDRRGVHLGPTDRDGQLVHRHAQQLFGVRTRMQLTAHMPGGTSPAVRIEANAMPSEVTLHLPSGGRVTVLAVDADGAPLQPQFLTDPTVQLALLATKPPDDVGPVGGFHQVRVPFDATGRAVFDPVRFGGFVVAQLSTHRQSSPAPGPSVEQPEIEITVREPRNSIVLTGVLLDPDGAPLAQSTYRVGSTTALAHYGRTDAHGRFRLHLQGTRSNDDAVLTFHDPATLGEAELPRRRLDIGRNELGDVRLRAQELLASGRLVLDDPTAAAQVEIAFERQLGAGWHLVRNLRPERGANGSFTLRGSVPAGTRMRLLLHSREFQPVAPIEFLAGTTGLEIPVPRGGVVHAELLVDDTVPLARWMLQLRRLDAPEPTNPWDDLDARHEQRARAARADGRVQHDWRGLTPGRYRLRVLCDGEDSPVATIDAIEVGDGPCKDPRLVGIDLRGRVRTFEVRATGKHGDPIGGNDAFVLVRSRQGAWRGFQLGSGAANLATAAPVDLLVCAPGHRSEFVDGVFAARTIALQPAATVTVAKLPTNLPAGAVVRLRLQPQLDVPHTTLLRLDNGRTQTVTDFLAQEIAVDGAANTFAARFAGPHSTSAVLRVPGLKTVDAALLPPTIDLPSAGEATLTLDATALQQALDEAHR